MFEQRLKKLRIENNLTQKQLGDKVKLNGSTISFYERGKRIPDYKTLNQLANFFNVSTDYLIGRVDTRNHKTKEIIAQMPDEVLEEADCNSEVFLEFIEALAKAMKIGVKLESITKIIEVINNIKRKNIEF